MSVTRTLRILSLVCAAALLATAVTFASGAGGNSPGTGEIAERRINARAHMRNFRNVHRAGRTAVTDNAPRSLAPARGWGNERVFSRWDDWEPNIAADPSSDRVYMLTTQYGGPKACTSCPGSGPIRMRISTDGGHSFGPATYLCPCPGGQWQADPLIEVDADGDLYAGFLSAPFGTYFVRSTDEGATWTAPVRVMPSLVWDDHPWMAVSPDGQHVYIGANQQDNYQASSHDFGVTWSAPIKTNPPGDYYFSTGAEVMPNGDIVFVAGAVGCCTGADSVGPADVVVIRSTDMGATWTETIVDTSAPMPFCTVAGCPNYQYATEPALAQNGDGDLALAYQASETPLGGMRMWIRTSTDNGATWSARQQISPGGSVIASFPAIAGGDGGRFTVAWADNRNGPTRFNTYASDSLDGGATWSTAVDISNLGTGARYKHPAGYQFSYGDYFGITINDAQEAVAAWGESFHYTGPGGTWYNAQQGAPT